MEPRPALFVEASILAPVPPTSVILAAETFQRTGSFKYRAAYRVVSESAAKHFVAASSGNFGQALAAVCSAYRRQCTIVVPSTAARVKINAIRQYRAELVLADLGCISRAACLAAVAADHPGCRIVDSAEDPDVVDGNATLGAEIAQYDFDAVLVPVGGGALAAGIALALERRNHPARLVGVEPAVADRARQSLAAGRILELEGEPQTVADGARVRLLGRRAFSILSRRMEAVLAVSEQEIAAAVSRLFIHANLKAEPTAALSVAGLLSSGSSFMGNRVCCVVTGANVDPDVYASMIRPCAEN